MGGGVGASIASQHLARRPLPSTLVHFATQALKRRGQEIASAFYPRGSDRSTSLANTADPYGIAASLKL
jgi:hypothetical protein